MSTRTERREDRDGVSVHVRPTSKRATPFLASLIATFLIMPALFLLSRAVMLWDQATGVMVANGWFISGCVLATISVGVGLFRAKRTNFVIKHVSVTVFIVGLGGNLYTLLGFGYRFLNVTAVFTAVIVWGSWMLYRIDAFRAAAKGESTDGWADVIGLARSRPKKVRTTDTHVTIDVEHGPGDTHQTVQAAAKKLESATGAIVGRTTVTQPGGRSDTTQIRFLMADPFAAGWRKFPGPSHPGATFALPFRTAYYEDGEDQWFGFARGSVASPLTSFVAPQATFVGIQGTTGGGKSGELNNVAAEALTRCDVALVWLDVSKFRQNAGWCADLLAFGACDKPRERPNGATPRKVALALRRIAEYRVELFGQVSLDAVTDGGDMERGREWTPDLARDTGEPAILVIADEADEYVMTREWEWLGARGRSLGIFLCISVPRASTGEMTAKLRSSLATWKTFAIGDKYSHDFSLSTYATEAGADPTKLREPGLHYLDSAPGIPEDRWPVLCRTFRSDRSDLRRMVLHARSTFTPMPLSPGSVEAMGDLYDQIRPDVLLGLRQSTPKDDGGLDPEAVEAAAEAAADQANAAAPPPAGRPTRADRAAVTPAGEPADGDGADWEETQRIRQEIRDEPGAGFDTEEGREVEPINRTPEGSTLPDGEGGIGEVATLTHPGLDEEAADARNPIGVAGPDVDLPDTKPAAPNPEQAEAAFDDALIRLYRAGKSTITNADVHEYMVYAWSDPTMSRRLGAVCEGTRVLPEGLTLERLGYGRFQIHKTAPSPRPRA